MVRGLRQCGRAWWTCLGVLLAWYGATSAALAQGEADWWYFNGSAALHFTPTGPVVVPSLPPGWDSEEGSAAVSDAAGNLLFYTDGSTIWTRQHQRMPGGTGLGLPLQYSATQGALIVQDPVTPARYYVFRQAAYAYPNSLAYAVVDLRLNNGLGAVVGAPVALPPLGGQMGEKLTGVAHANGRDTWVLAHGARGSNGDVFYAYLVSPAGVTASPVTTAVGASYLNNSGYLRASPNGTLLASAVGGNPGVGPGRLELLAFDAATGRPSAPVVLATPFDVYGVEFSADGSKLYASTENEGTLLQFDLLAGAAAPQTQTVVGRLSAGGEMAGLQRGPDGRIYVAQTKPYLGVIAQPNTAGAACGYQERALPCFAMYGLPNFPNQVAGPGRWQARIAAAAGCAGDVAAFRAALAPVPAPPGVVYTWDFGDPGSGPANTGTGPAAGHRYAVAGTYLVRLQAHWPGGGPATATTTAMVPVTAPPAVALGPRVQALCPGDSLLLDAGAAAGVTVRWQDGTAGPRYRVRGPGTYRVTATASTGCTARDSVVVTAALVPRVSLGPDTTVCSVQPTVVLRPSPQPAGTTYRWHDGTTAAAYTASQPGMYWVEVRNDQGCTTRAEVRVAQRDCPVLIPNIVTPNGDGRNDHWAVVGLHPADWTLTVYTRWGTAVYTAAAYDNTWQATGLAAGVYYYRLQHHRNGQQYRGWVEVVR